MNENVLKLLQLLAELPPAALPMACAVMRASLAGFRGGWDAHRLQEEATPAAAS